MLIISIILVSISFFILIKENKKGYQNNIRKKYYPIARHINKEYFRFGLTQNLQNAIEDMGFEIEENSKNIDNIIKQKETRLIFQRKDNLHILALFTDGKHNYLFFHTPFEELMLIDRDINTYGSNKTIKIVFALILLSLLALIYTSYKKLLPLNKLKNEIKRLEESKGEVSFNFIKENSKDEVSLLAHEFENSINKLNKFKEARNVFIRNIMHELKTPITKGKFLAELPQSSENKELLKTVFYRLESLINEFASIEEILVKKDSIDKKTYFLDDIIDNAIDLLYIAEEKIDFDTKELKIDVNFKLFSIAVKNLIDNGIKYSKDRKISIKTQENSILFISSGEKLPRKLNTYLEPFNQDTKDPKNSFGLGLYIIHNILNAHNFKFEYEYKEDQNIFIIKF